MNAGSGKLAKRFGVTPSMIIEAKEEVRSNLGMNSRGVTGECRSSNVCVYELNDSVVKVNNDKGTIESQIVISYEPKSIDELTALHKIDTNLYKVSNYWTKQRGDKFTSSLLCTKISQESVQNFTQEFTSFLETYKPSSKTITPPVKSKLSRASLIIPKQDAHFNKYDIMGDNDINTRFGKSKTSIVNSIKKASFTNYIEEIVYIVGSDQFNSEWTSLTTKGTEQSNILSYQDSFIRICDHEVEIINTLLSNSEKVKIIFIPGNHDEFVGWHLINWLETYYRHNDRLNIDSSILNTKYYKYNNTAIMLNHGDAIKPKELAHKFPIGFKDQWSVCDHFAILTGDKHTELSMDIHGIRFYRVPQLSSAISKWDDKNGYIDDKAEMQVFVISEENGITDIYKTIL